MTALRRISDGYGNFVEKISHALFMVAVGSVFLMIIPVILDVIIRATIDRSIPGVIEIEEILMLFMVLFGLSLPEIREGHIKVELLTERLPKWVCNNLTVFHAICMVAFTSAMTWFVFNQCLEEAHAGVTTADLLMPMWIFLAAALPGLLVFVLATVRTLLNATVLLIEDGRWLGIFVAVVAASIFLSLPFLLADTELAYSMSLLGGLGILLLIILLFLGMPIAFAMGLVGILGMMTITPVPWVTLSTVGSSTTHTAMSFTLTVLPMFILMGELALYAGISKDMFTAASMWLGRMPGGLAISGVVGCAGFAAICGDSLATAMTMTSVALPEMKERGYNPGLACASLAAGGTLGILIPPSLGFIFYAIITEESLGRLFLAGIIPGILLTTMFCGIIWFTAKRHPELCPTGQRWPLIDRLRALTGVIPMMLLIFLVLGGILSGLFSPTEGGAVGAAGTLVYALVRGRLSVAHFVKSIRGTTMITTRLMFILIGVNVLGYFLAITRLPFELADLVLAITSNKYLVLLLIVMLYLLLGCMLNVGPMILLTLPAIFPTVIGVGFDPIWFGVITVILMEMGQITPPVGIVVFAIAGMPDSAPMGSIFRRIVPFVLAMLLCVIILTIFPDLVTFLPNYLM